MIKWVIVISRLKKLLRTMTVHFMTTSYVLLDREHSHPLSLTNISKIQDENLNYVFNWLHRQGTSSLDGVLLKIPLIPLKAMHFWHVAHSHYAKIKGLYRMNKMLATPAALSLKCSWMLLFIVFIYLFFFALTNSECLKKTAGQLIKCIRMNGLTFNFNCC